MRDLARLLASPAVALLTTILLLTAASVSAAPLPAPLPGQSPADAAVTGPETVADDDRGPRPIELPDILAWKSIRTRSLSDDGAWFAYYLAPAEGDGEVVVRSVTGETEHRFEAGELPMFGGGRLEFSGDAEWIAFQRRPTAAEAKAAEKTRKPAQPSAVLVELATGESTEFEGVSSFDFSGTGWLAIHRARDEKPDANGPPAKEQPPGTDLLLRRLADGRTLTVGNVAEYELNETGELLALAISTDGRMGNGVQLHRLGTGQVIPLDSAEAAYRRIAWTEEGDALAVLRGTRDGALERHVVLAFNELGAEDPNRVVFDPAEAEGFPADMTVSPDHDATWNEARDALVFRIHELEEPEEAGESEEDAAEGEPDAPEVEPDAGPSPGPAGDEDLDTADLVIWHWKDDRLQSRQQVQARRDESFGYLATYRIDEDRFIRLADDDVPVVAPAPESDFAIGIDNDPYERLGNLDGRRYRDVYVVDMRTGERKLALEKARWVFGPSPAGTHFYFFQEGNFHTYDMRDDSIVDVTGDLPVPFWNEEDDHNVVMPPRFQFGLGWTEDGQQLVLTDGWDLWRVPVDGGEGINLTGNGREDQIRYRRPFRLDPDAEGLDLTSPMYVSTYGEWTKKGGIARVAGDGAGAEMLVWDDAVYGGLLKAEEADVWLLTRQSHEEFPDYRITDADLTIGDRITDANPQQSELAWSDGVRLVDYTSDKGDKLQGALFLPAGYEPGESYPTIVYIYERLSQRANAYDAPSANGFDKSVYTSNGYAVLMPDISYKVDDPGMSAVWSVLPALDAAVETGIVDPDSVGIHGHSWGGYQTSFLITQTDRFAAAVAGAPLTNMISMYSLIYKNSGGGNGAIFESSQGRFTGGPWEVPEAYVRNSPVYHAQNVTTPLVLLHNDRDGAVDFTQGVEYYNTLRRMEKNVIMLQYVGENHGLRKPANRKDYTVRMREFFDHYLRDQDMADWLRDGIPYLEREEHLKERARTIAQAVEEAREEREP